MLTSQGVELRLKSLTGPFCQVSKFWILRLSRHTLLYTTRLFIVKYKQTLLLNWQEQTFIAEVNFSEVNGKTRMFCLLVTPLSCSEQGIEDLDWQAMWGVSSVWEMLRSHFIGGLWGCYDKTTRCILSMDGLLWRTQKGEQCKNKIGQTIQPLRRPMDLDPVPCSILPSLARLLDFQWPVSSAFSVLLLLPAIRYKYTLFGMLVW